MTDKLILDADSIAYKAAAANEKRSIVVTHKENGKVMEFDNRTAFKDFLKENEKVNGEDYELTDVQDPRHISYGKSLVRNMIQGYTVHTGVKEVEIYIGGANNFRDAIPLPKKYKGKREDSLRPMQLKDIRYFMIQELGAIVVDGMEVDDMGSIRAYEGYKAGTRIIQVTEDKDAAQCMGWLYNPAKHTKPIYIDGLGELHMEGKKLKGTGRLWLYAQSTMGDPVDCYRPADLCEGAKFGDVACRKLFEDCKTDRDCWVVMNRQYSFWYPNDVTYTAWNGDVHKKDYIDIMQMYVDCAFMRRWQGDRINCREVLTKLGII